MIKSNTHDKVKCTEDVKFQCCVFSVQSCLQCNFNYIFLNNSSDNFKESIER